MADIKFYEPGEPVTCAEEGCKALFHRPQDAGEALSTKAVAQLHGWRIADVHADTLNCPHHAGGTS